MIEKGGCCDCNEVKGDASEYVKSLGNRQIASVLEYLWTIVITIFLVSLFQLLSIRLVVYAEFEQL